MPAVRVLVVDDSVVVRKLLSEALASTAEIELVATASSGAIALAKIPQVNPDIVILDIEMPGLNGIETLREIRKLYPKLPVIMFSSLTEQGAAVTLEALSLGASDYVTKPSNSSSLASAMGQVRAELTTRILSLVAQSRATPVSRILGAEKKSSVVSPIEILAIGVSAGGPNALAQVIPQLPSEFPVPVVIVQHMPPVFTRLLAERLNSQSQLRVHEAHAGAVLAPGHVWIAPGDYHMTVARKGVRAVLELNQDSPENSCRPAVDVLFRSLACAYGPNILAVVMTGMGSDGARGAVHIREAGGEIMVQDEPSSVVWGMPGAVLSAAGADMICPLTEMSHQILRKVEASRTRNSKTNISIATTI
jgi:two-component system, chemotaxis family, protein-glutamate methylesterase/glutaminase